MVLIRSSLGPLFWWSYNHLCAACNFLLTVPRDMQVPEFLLFPRKEISRDERRNPGLSYFITESHLALCFPVLLELDVLLCLETKLQCMVGRVKALLYDTSPPSL